jgi:hypothetical protein
MPTETKLYLGYTWFLNRGQEGGAHADMLANLLDEPNVYMEIRHPDNCLYGVMPGDDADDFMAFDRHAVEIIPTSRRRKFYLDYDVDVPDTDQPTDAHDRALLELQAKAVADAESVCGPGRAVLSGSWGKKSPKNETDIIPKIR